MTHTVETDSSPTGAEPYRWRWVALFVVLAAEVMDLMDAMITIIAAPSIQKELGGSSSMIQWLSAGYTLAMAIGLVTGGRLGDLYGRRRMFVVGAFGFTLFSLLCGLATSPEMLIGARVLQGLAGAVMVPQGLGIIKEVFPPKELAAAFGAFGPVMALSTVGGPVLAGWLVDGDLFGTGWRMIFLINLPIGLIALLGALRYLPASKTSHASRLDLTGTGLVSAASFLLIFPLVQGRDLDWPAWTFALMAASIPVFALFCLHQYRKERAGGDPLVVMSLFRKRSFTGGLITGLVFFSGMVGFSLVFGLYTQIALGYDPLKAGLAGLPNAIGTLIGFVLVNASGLARKVGRRLIHIGAVAMAGGVTGVALTLNIAGMGVTPWQLAPALLLTGAGMSLIMAPFFDIVLAGVEPHESGSASGTLTAVQQLGGALGTAAIGTLFFGLVKQGRSLEDAMLLTIWVEVGLLAVTFATAFLLPRRARAEQEIAH
ncbi:DHA2 family efflux MFS transporter permease subunit [Streptosporangium vulgare]|uniref:DHA2 family efflux MFS transporter permease subunit n=1 Tax=Streptosporangium vulgare TaxID=46190 RepID=A0ABV5TIE7_9ACTN